MKHAAFYTAKDFRLAGRYDNMAAVFVETFPIKAGDFTSAGEASAKIKGMLKMIGLDPALTRRVTIAAYEAEMNLIIHSHGGEMVLTLSPEAVRLECNDTGPGIDDIEAALQEGFSTASEDVRMMGFGAGMGLPNIKKNSDDFNMHSDTTGTNLKLGFNIQTQ